MLALASWRIQNDSCSLISVQKEGREGGRQEEGEGGMFTEGKKSRTRLIVRHSSIQGPTPLQVGRIATY